MLPFAAREKINKCTSYLLSHTHDNGTMYLLPRGLENITPKCNSSQAVRLVREEKNSDGPELKIDMRKDGITHVSDNREREKDRTSHRPTAVSEEKHALKRTFIYLVSHGTIISATCCATILYLSLLALALIGICNSLFEPLFFSLFLSLSFLSPLLVEQIGAKKCLSPVSPWSTALATRHSPFLTVKNLPGENVVGLQMNQYDPDAHLSLLSRDRFLGGWTRQEFSFLRFFEHIVLN